MASKLKAKSPELSVRRKPKIAIYGKSGVGKTFNALDFPKCYYIDTEGGAKEKEYIEKMKASGAAYFGPEDGANDLKEVVGQFKALATEEHGYLTVIVDSITKPFNTLIGMEQERLGESDAYGASKKPAVALMRSLYTWIDRVDMNVIIIAHAKDEYGMVGGKREQIGLTADAHDKLEYELELAAEVQKQGPKRVIRIRKSRIAAFEEGKFYAWNYDDFADRYGRADIERGMVRVELASTADVEEIRRLVDVMKVDDSITSKWTSKAGVDTFEEFTVDQAAGILKWLNEKLKGKAA